MLVGHNQFKMMLSFYLALVSNFNCCLTRCMAMHSILIILLGAALHAILCASLLVKVTMGLLTFALN